MPKPGGVLLGEFTDLTEPGRVVSLRGFRDPGHRTDDPDVLLLRPIGRMPALSGTLEITVFPVAVLGFADFYRLRIQPAVQQAGGRVLVLLESVAAPELVVSVVRPGPASVTGSSLWRNEVLPQLLDSPRLLRLESVS
ncbi:hypothetical protein D5S17_18650 [Pseudonocardiaceae bacterium YIM PH 21723]|nr:hypothetical protein D5S17_18650 [Pseudonocardiaceae bacterium YIM PH 21723]